MLVSFLVSIMRQKEVICVERAIAVAVNGFLFGALLVSLFMFFNIQEVQVFVFEVQAGIEQVQESIEQVRTFVAAVKSGTLVV